MARIIRHIDHFPPIPGPKPAIEPGMKLERGRGRSGMCPALGKLSQADEPTAPAVYEQQEERSESRFAAIVILVKAAALLIGAFALASDHADGAALCLCGSIVLGGIGLMGWRDAHTK